MLKAYDNQHSLECHNFNDELSEGAVLEVQDRIGRQFLNTVVVADDLFAKTETTLPPNWFMAASNEADVQCVKILPCELLDREDVTTMKGWVTFQSNSFLEPVNNVCLKGTPILPGFRLALADRPRLAPKYLPEPGLE
ncbi:hypothetical protein BY996DRAFT_6410442 [Phakopsora pachyrhizi]|nr:hypothetical protein BY996DRAFT_6410442 [Phakopsora pachyrhizi]